MKIFFAIVLIFVTATTAACGLVPSLSNTTATGATEGVLPSETDNYIGQNTTTWTFTKADDLARNGFRKFVFELTPSDPKAETGFMRLSYKDVEVLMDYFRVLNPYHLVRKTFMTPRTVNCVEEAIRFPLFEGHGLDCSFDGVGVFFWECIAFHLSRLELPYFENAKVLDEKFAKLSIPVPGNLAPEPWGIPPMHSKTLELLEDKVLKYSQDAVVLKPLRPEKAAEFGFRIEKKAEYYVLLSRDIWYAKITISKHWPFFWPRAADEEMLKAHRERFELLKVQAIYPIQVPGSPEYGIAIENMSGNTVYAASVTSDVRAFDHLVAHFGVTAYTDLPNHVFLGIPNFSLAERLMNPEFFSEWFTSWEIQYVDFEDKYLELRVQEVGDPNNIHSGFRWIEPGDIEALFAYFKVKTRQELIGKIFGGTSHLLYLMDELFTRARHLMSPAVNLPVSAGTELGAPSQGPHALRKFRVERVDYLDGATCEIEVAAIEGGFTHSARFRCAPEDLLNFIALEGTVYEASIATAIEVITDPRRLATRRGSP